MPLDTSTRPELASLNQRIADIAAEREPLQRTYDELAPPVMRLQQLIIQHRSGMHQLRGDEDDDAYTGRLLELRQIEQEIDELRNVADLPEFRAAADALKLTCRRRNAAGRRADAPRAIPCSRADNRPS